MKLTKPEAYQLLHDGSLTLAQIERAGVRVDMLYLNSTIEKIKGTIGKIEQDMKADKEVGRVWQREYGHKANMGSRSQLAKILYGRLGYKPRAWTPASFDDEGRLLPGARAKTDKDSLNDIDLPFVKMFMKVEQLKKALSTYLLGIRREAVQHTDGQWYVHPVYNLHIASTYRSTCDSPNFQNQPKRDEEMANLVRRSFLPHPGDCLVEIDFSTLEVRIAYTYNKDPVLKRYLIDPTTDMHRDTAADLFMLPIPLLVEHAKDAKKTVRDSAKNQFVFPEFFGSVWFQCANEIWRAMKRKNWKVPGSDKLLLDHLAEKGITELGSCNPQEDPEDGTFAAHVQEVERKLWQRFKKYAQWKRDFYAEYQRRGYFEMYTGFVINTLHKKNDVINYPVQGSASHCKLWCLIQIVNWLDKYMMRSKVVGEIHDSIVASVRPSELNDFLTYCKWCMTVALPRAWKWITIPMETESDVAAIDQPWNKQETWVEDNETETWLPKSVA